MRNKEEKLLKDYIESVNTITDDYKDTYENVSWDDMMQCWRSLRVYLDNVFTTHEDDNVSMIASGLKNEIIDSLVNGEKFRTHSYIKRAMELHEEINRKT